MDRSRTAIVLDFAIWGRTCVSGGWSQGALGTERDYLFWPLLDEGRGEERIGGRVRRRIEDGGEDADYVIVGGTVRYRMVCMVFPLH